MMFKFLLTILPIIYLIDQSSTAKPSDLPPYFPRCNRFDPKLSECLLKATETVKPFLVKGVPELNVPPIEPFVIPEISLKQGTSALNFKADLKNITTRGLSSYKFSTFDFDVPNKKFFCKAVIGHLELEGDYVVTGKILVAPIEGRGLFTVNLDNVNVTFNQEIIVEKRRNVDYAKPIFTNTSIDVGGPKVKLSGLFDGNEELNRVTNNIINDNVKVLFEDMRPLIEEVITNIVVDLLFKIVQIVPYDKLYPIA